MIKLKIDQKQYYTKKSAFKKLYKSLGLTWKEGTNEGNVWGNEDNSKYLRKLSEEVNCKRFYACNVPEMVVFLKNIGAIEIDDDILEEVTIKKYERTKRDYFSIPSDFKVVVGDSLDQSNMSTEFKRKWRELEIKYAGYNIDDLCDEIEKNNVLQ